MSNRREVALILAEDLISDIELGRLPPPDIAKKTSRLARLLDDVEAVEWLQFEVSGYPAPLPSPAVAAAKRSGRIAPPEDGDGGERYWTTSLSRLAADVEAAKLQLQAAIDAPVSISSANPNQWVAPPRGNSNERAAMSQLLAKREELTGKIVGAFHNYAAEKEIELRFGAAVEDAFTVVRTFVDAEVARLTPVATIKFSAAFENASSDNPEHWANAASACRRLLKAIADELQPAGPPVKNRPMTDDKYINRLILWIEEQRTLGNTLREVMVADLADFGKRIDALDDAGHKGAHSEVTQYEASRFITGTYLLIGDVLNLWNAETPQVRS